MVGADIAADLLDAARAKADAANLPIDYQIGDAESLPFEDGAFDAVVSTFGVMFASRPEAAAGSSRASAARAAGSRSPPGSRTAICSDVRGDEALHAARRRRPAPPSPFEWGRTERIRELLGSAFELRFETGVSYYREPSAEAAWATFSTGYGPTRTLAASLDAERRAAFATDFIAFHDGFPTELGICVPREYWVTVGVRR